MFPQWRQAAGRAGWDEEGVRDGGAAAGYGPEVYGVEEEVAADLSEKGNAMWVCRKCKEQVDRGGKICRACGGILEEVPDGQPLAENVQVVETDDRSACRPPPGSTEAAAKANALAREDRPSSDKESAGPEWKCPNCGEMVPGNFDVCWKCLTTKAGEHAADPGPVLAEVVEADEDTDCADPQSEALEAQGQETPLQARCPRCGSTKIIPDLTIVDQGEGSDGKLNAVIFGSPQALIFKDRLYGEVKADICGKCGHVELRVANPRALYLHYRNSGAMDQTFAPESETETDIAWEMKRLLRKAMSCERRGKYEEAVSHLEQFIAKTDNAGNIELARTHIRRIQERMSQGGGHVS